MQTIFSPDEQFNLAKQEMTEQIEELSRGFDVGLDVMKECFVECTNHLNEEDDETAEKLKQRFDFFYDFFTKRLGDFQSLTEEFKKL